jgi:hypothetical protein
VSFHYQFFADQLDNPNNNDWAVSAMAPVTSDSLNTALSERAYNHTTESGAGWLLRMEPSLSNWNMILMMRPAVIPTVANVVGLRLYQREIANGASVGAWGFRQFGPFTFGTSQIFWSQYNVNFNLNTSGPTLSAGKLYQFELTRVSQATGLIGNMNLLEVHIELS